jgi:hypothetical protein
MTNATIETAAEETTNDAGTIFPPAVVTFLEKAAKAERAYNATTNDTRDRFTEVLQEVDFETQTRQYGADYEETVRGLAKQGYTAMSWRNYHCNYQAEVSKEVDNLITMICHMSADTKMPDAASALWDYGTRLTNEPNGFINRAGQMMALQALIDTPEVCQGLAARLQEELARYEPELWKVLKVEAPPA